MPEAQHIPQAWRLLRVAVVLWACLVLARHATYWGGVLIDARAAAGPDALSVALWPVAEACILVAALIAAMANPLPTVSARRTLRLLAIAFVTIIAAEFFWNDLRQSGALAPVGLRQGLRLAWQLTSRAQLLVVPLLCISYADRA